MKTRRHSSVLAVVAAVLAWYLNLGLGCAQVRAAASDLPKKQAITVSIRADGSCVVRDARVEARESAESDALYRESRYQTDDERPNSGHGAQSSGPGASTSLSDAELERLLRRTLRPHFVLAEDPRFRVEALQVGADTVEYVTVEEYGSIQEWLVRGWVASCEEWSGLRHVQIGEDSRGRLRMSFLRGAEPETKGGKEKARELREWRRFIESEGLHRSLRFELPGRVLRSDLPNKRGNATWIDLDPDRPASIDAAGRLVVGPVTILAESGGLRIEEPIDSWRLGEYGDYALGPLMDLPVVGYATGYSVRAESIALFSYKRFAASEPYYENSSHAIWYGSEVWGLSIDVGITPPRGRVIRRVELPVLKITRDDRGRVLRAEPHADSNDVVDSFGAYEPAFFPGYTENSQTEQFELATVLPHPDARRIQRLEGEVVVMSVAGWRGVLFHDVRVGGEQNVDLSTLLPGARLTVLAAGRRSHSEFIDVLLEGPASIIGSLEVGFKREGAQHGVNQARLEPARKIGDTWKRRLLVKCFGGDRTAEEESTLPLIVGVRLPLDPRRERLQFKLPPMDLSRQTTAAGER